MTGSKDGAFYPSLPPPSLPPLSFPILFFKNVLSNARSGHSPFVRAPSIPPSLPPSLPQAASVSGTCECRPPSFTSNPPRATTRETARRWLSVGVPPSIHYFLPPGHGVAHAAFISSLIHPLPPSAPPSLPQYLPRPPCGSRGTYHKTGTFLRPVEQREGWRFGSSKEGGREGGREGCLVHLARGFISILVNFSHRSLPPSLPFSLPPSF